MQNSECVCQRGVAVPFFLRRLSSPSRRRSYFNKSYFNRAIPLPVSLPRHPKLRPYAVTPFDLMNFKIMPWPAAYEIRASIFAGEQSLRDDEFRICVRIVVYKCKYFREDQTQDGRRTRKIRRNCVPRSKLSFDERNFAMKKNSVAE